MQKVTEARATEANFSKRGRTANELYSYLQESNAHPTQGWGVINPTNEGYYFRYRSGRVKLAVLKTPSQKLDDLNIKAEFEEVIDMVDAELPESMVKEYLSRWINEYLKGKPIQT